MTQVIDRVGEALVPAQPITVTPNSMDAAFSGYGNPGKTRH